MGRRGHDGHGRGEFDVVVAPEKGADAAWCVGGRSRGHGCRGRSQPDAAPRGDEARRWSSQRSAAGGGLGRPAVLARGGVSVESGAGRDRESPALGTTTCGRRTGPVARSVRGLSLSPSLPVCGGDLGYGCGGMSGWPRCHSTMVIGGFVGGAAV
ncbi:atherin-like [Iris pallida]|uniref:Atherin-like n=1 Tax=Iris pallida TaxID=29817 RepID=A0AAX6F189_IRIPA|nr:atherin-like [Iris pallida]